MMKKTINFFTTLIITGMMICASITGVQAKNLGLATFDPSNFDDPQDNLYMPMAAKGFTYVYHAETEDEFMIDEITYSNDTKDILGVTCMVVYDVEYVDVEGLGLIVTEATEDWFAWDNFGNVWYFGEDTLAYEYDDEWNLIETTDEGSWEAGVGGAEPGIVMLGEPMPGLSYQQEYYEDEAEDMGKVLRLNATVSIDYDDYENCLVTKEWTPLSPGEVEHKYYAPGEGLVFIEELKEKTVLVELVDIY
jgi:hypothetical protein